MTVNKIPAQTAISTGRGGYNSLFEFGNIQTYNRKKSDLDMTFCAGSKQMRQLLSKLSDNIDFQDETSEAED